MKFTFSIGKIRFSSLSPSKESVLYTLLRQIRQSHSDSFRFSVDYFTDQIMNNRYLIKVCWNPSLIVTGGMGCSRTHDENVGIWHVFATSRKNWKKQIPFSSFSLQFLTEISHHSYVYPCLQLPPKDTCCYDCGEDVSRLIKIRSGSDKTLTDRVKTVKFIQTLF